MRLATLLLLSLLVAEAVLPEAAEAVVGSVVDTHPQLLQRQLLRRQPSRLLQLLQHQPLHLPRQQQSHPALLPRTSALGQKVATLKPCRLCWRRKDSSRCRRALQKELTAP